MDQSMIIVCSLCGQKNKVKLEPTDKKILCGKCGAALLVPTYVKSKNYYENSTKNIKSLRNENFLDHLTKLSQSNNPERTNFSQRLGNVVYVISIIFSIAWALKFIDSIEVIIFGWSLIFGTGWTVRYLLSGTTRLWPGFSSNDKLKYNSKLISVLTLCVLGTVFLYIFSMDIDKHKITIINPDRLEMMNIHADFHRSDEPEWIREAEDRFNKESGLINLYVHGDILNKSNVTLKYLRLRIELSNCSNLDGSDCMVVGDEEEDIHLDVPSNQLRAFDLRFNFKALPELTSWHYKLNIVRAL